ncbi:MAG: TonB-dependent receptor [Terriglobales bacterium]
MRSIRVFLTLVCAAVVSATLIAQTSDTATLRGHVLDRTGAAVAGATVTATNGLTGAARTVTSNADGNYTLAGLPIAGAYTLAATHSGFQPGSVSNLTLIGGATATVDLHLGVSTASTTITVTGTVGAVRADEPQLGDHIGIERIDNTPLLGNQITALPLLNSANRPAINQGDIFTNQTLITTGGSGRRQTSFLVDGASGNDSWGRQTIFTALPADAVQEMTVLETPFSAEYGATTGGVVNIVTKSGGQKFHGDAQYSVRPNGLAAGLVGYSALSSSAHPTNDLFNQGDWSLSGPLSSKTQFAFAGEVTWRDRDSPVISPAAPSVFTGQYRGGLLTGRLDHQFSENNSAFFRGSEDSFYDTNPNGSVGGNALPSTDRIFRRRTFSALAGDNDVINASMVNALRLQFQLASPITQFAPVNYGTALSVPIAVSGFQTTFSSGTSQSALLLNRQYEIADTVSADWGQHQVVVGVDVLRSHNGGNSKEFGGPNFLGTFNYATCTVSLSYCESSAYLNNLANVTSFTQSFGTASYAVDDTLSGLFVQDNYHLRPNLTVNAGLRYERQSFTQAEKNFAPRVGFAYTPWKDTVLRGGYGIFYGQIHDNYQADFTLGSPTGVFNFTATPGQPGFPSTVAPWTSFPSGANVPVRSLTIAPGQPASAFSSYFPLSVLEGYPTSILNPYSEQWSLGVERAFPRDWTISADYIGNHTLRIDSEQDLDAPPPFSRTAQDQWLGVTTLGSGQYTCDATGETGALTQGQLTACAANAANAARPLWIYDASQGITPAYTSIATLLNNGAAWYDALEINANHRFSHDVQALISYTWSHALDTVDQDYTRQSPNEPQVFGAPEKGNAIFDQRHRLVVSGLYAAPFQISVGGVATLASGTPFNIVTGTTNGGDSGQEIDRPVINGVVIARNSGYGSAIYSFDPFLERPFQLGDRTQLRLRIEAFNVFNRGNFVSFNGTYGNGLTPLPGLGTNSIGLSSQLTPREIQLSARVSF